MAKSAKKNTRLMIVGTEGHEDYLVIARQNGYVLGMKALLQMNLDGAMFGFRLRMQKADTDPEAKVTDLPAKEKEVMVKTFPSIPWNKRSLTRFSTVLTLPSSFGFDFRAQLLEEAATKVGEMLGEVQEKIDPIKLINKEDALSFVNEKFAEIVVMVEEHFAKQNDLPADGADVLNFPGADHDIE